MFLINNVLCSYRYQDEDGTWRNEYDDQGYEFADDEYDLEEAEEITKQQSEEERIRAEAERTEFDQSRGTSLTGLESIPEQFDEYGQPILSDKAYRKQLARDRWHWAFTKIVQVRNYKNFFAPFFDLLSHFDLCSFGWNLV